MNRTLRRTIYVLLLLAGVAVAVHAARHGLPDLSSLNPHGS
jgi:hypothetical protein